MMIRKLPPLGAAIVAIAAAVTLAGCASAGGTADAATAQLEQRTTTVDSVPAAAEGGLYVARAQGKSIAGGAAGIPDLQTGRAQLVAGNYESFIHAQIAGKFGATPQQLADTDRSAVAAAMEKFTGADSMLEFGLTTARYQIPKLIQQEPALAAVVPQP
jgi:hypothetical protein